MPILKKDYEACFKEGFRLGVRLTRAKDLLKSAQDARGLGDTALEKLNLDFSREWSGLAKNSGRKFCPVVAHEPEQPAFDFGDIETLLHNEPFKRKTG